MDYKDNSYNLILVIIDYLSKMTPYKPVKVIINIIGLTKFITNIMIKYHSFFKSIISDKSSIYTLKF